MNGAYRETGALDTFLYGFADFNDTCMLTPKAIPRFTIGFRTLPHGMLRKMPHAKEVTLHTHGQDKYKRTLADVFLRDGTHVHHALVKDGWCWWYRKYAPLDTELEKLEKDAREAKTGLWADPQPVPPWEFRKIERIRR